MKLRRLLVAAFMAVAGLTTTLVVATPAQAATACPLYHDYDDASHGRSDSYGVWSSPNPSPHTKQGGTTCGTHVYSENTLGPIDVFVYERVWWVVGQQAFSHNPVLVHQFSNVNNEDSHLYDLGPVPTGAVYQVQILAQSHTVGVASAQCSTTQPCFVTARG